MKPGLVRRCVIASLALASLPGAALSAPKPAPAADASRSVSFDGYSFKVDGQRVYLWSGEFHPYRLPDPDLWPDIFQKMKAAGFNTASIYFSWGYHSPREGAYDFTGVRDMDRVLDAAQRAGIWVIARAGPYINAEVDSGGFPIWLSTKQVKNRSADPAFLKYADEWLTQIDAILARHQWVDGKGPVIAYQVENEFYDGSAGGRLYMKHLEEKARADGIKVPLIGNHNATFAKGEGALDVDGWDYYPQGFDCSNPAVWKPAPDMARNRVAGQPLYTAEFQGGAFDPWGGPGYGKCAELINDRFARLFYKSNLAAGATAQNFYMLFGGTSWGWQAIPQNYTSYDYGSAITEARQLEPKYYEDKLIGYALEALTPLLQTDPAAPAAIDNPALIDTARQNPGDRTQFHFIRHGDTTSTSVEQGHFSLALKNRLYPMVPQEPGTALRIDGRDEKLLLADYGFGSHFLRYSTSELMFNATVGSRDVAIFYGDAGQPGETVLAFPRKPEVKVLTGSVETSWSGGDLRLNYTHGGLAKILVTGAKRQLILLVGDRAAASRIWRATTAAGAVVVIGSHLLRGAAIDGDRLLLTGDNDADPALEVFAPGTTQLSWNGQPLATRITSAGSLAAELPRPDAISLPALTDWKVQEESPEAATGFDDTKWQIADKRTSASITKPGSLPVLFADDYGFHIGNTWYRGHFQVAGSRAAPTGIYLKAQSGGPAGAFSVWLNGQFLGSVRGKEEGSFGFPRSMLRPTGDNIVSVLTVNMGHEEDYQSRGENRSARGLVEADLLGAPDAAIAWRVQGNGLADPVRGPFNNGGLYGERNGWSLPSFDDGKWASTTLPAATSRAGVTWYRTKFGLSLPPGQDVSLGLELSDRPERHYRATLFVNGWQLGNYINDVGPQHAFVVPNGLLNPAGDNSVAIAVWSTDASSGGLGTVRLVNYGSYGSSLGRGKPEP